MNRDKARPYFATMTNSILRMHDNWFDAQEFLLAVVNDDVDGEKIPRAERIKTARYLIGMTFVKPMAESVDNAANNQLTLQWGQPFDPATVQPTTVAGESARIN